MSVDTTVNAAATIGTLFWGAVLVSILIITVAAIATYAYVKWEDRNTFKQYKGNKP